MSLWNANNMTNVTPPLSSSYEDNTDEHSSLLPSSYQQQQPPPFMMTTSTATMPNNNNLSDDDDDSSNDSDEEEEEEDDDEMVASNYDNVRMTPPTSAMTAMTNNDSDCFRINRVGLTITAMIVLFLSILYTGMRYIQNEIHTLQDEIQYDTAKINELQDVLQQHEIVIERFNNSLSNSDVIQLLTKLQDNITETQHAINVSLQETIDTIQVQLNTTQLQIQQTVNDAEVVIQTQVEQVKKDVDQYVIQTQDQFSMENSFMVYQLAGTFTVLSCLISMWHMTAHVRKLYQPDVQRKILAILWMSPIYAITSWFSLVFPSAEGYLAIIKDGYEGYIIYTFLSFCIAVIGKGDRRTVVTVLADHADVHHLAPPYRCSDICQSICCWCRKSSKMSLYENNVALADAVLLQCQQFAMQFVFLRPITTISIVVLKKLNYWDTAEIWYQSPQLYIAIVQNVSIFVAFTGLLKFYHAVDQELQWCRPFAKFLCIKGVVFMTFWQGVAVSLLAHSSDITTAGGVMNATNKATEDEWAKRAQNFLICLEMLLFSIAHFYCFPIEEWEDGYRAKHTLLNSGKDSTKSNFGDTVALGDFVADLKLLLSSSSSKNNNKKKRLSVTKDHSSITTPPTILEEEGSYDDDDEVETTNTETTSIVSSSFDDEEKGLLVGHNNSLAVSSCSGNTNPQQQRRRITKYTSSKQPLNDSDQAFIAAAIEKSLGSMNDDPEIMEAKHRLLASGVLSPDFFDYSETEEEYCDDDDNNNNYDDKLNHDDDPIMKSLISEYNELNYESCADTIKSHDNQVDVDEENARKTRPDHGQSSTASDHLSLTNNSISLESVQPASDDTVLTVASGCSDDIATGTASEVNNPNIANSIDSIPTNGGLDEPNIANRNDTDDNVGTTTAGNYVEGTEFVEILKPSIFTTVATLAEIERHCNQQQK